MSGIADGLRATAKWIQSRDPLATNYIYCLQAADELEKASALPAGSADAQSPSGVGALIGWQPIESVPFADTEVLLWVASIEPEGDGWIKMGVVVRDEPLAMLDENGGEYWPHENGGYATHWMPLPEGPAA